MNMSKERPILFSGSMVRAILAGRKSQTRRVVKPQPHAGVRGSVFVPSGVEDGHGRALRCPYGMAGDRLWVRETWQEFFDDELPSDRTRAVRGRMGIPASPGRLSYVAYRADGDLAHSEYGKACWCPSIHMPRWASRILLAITDLRLHRLSIITEEESMAEGALDWFHSLDGDEQAAVFCGASIDMDAEVESPSARDCFVMLWDSINAKRGFPSASDPWVWAITFKPVEV